MTPLLSLLTRGLPVGAWRIDHFDTIRRSLVESFRYRVVVIDVNVEHDKAALLDQVAVRLGFPDWFGHNWDALHDSLSDLADRPETPSAPDRFDLIVLRTIDPSNSRSSAIGRPADDLATLIEIFTEVANTSGLCVLIAASEDLAPDLPDLAEIDH